MLSFRNILSLLYVARVFAVHSVGAEAGGLDDDDHTKQYAIIVAVAGTACLIGGLVGVGIWWYIKRRGRPVQTIACIEK